MVLLFISLFNPIFTNAQDLSGLEQGIKPYGSYHGGDIDSVSMVNGNLTLHIPLTSYPQRGGKLHMGFKLVYAATLLEPYATCNPVTHVCSSSGYQVDHRLSSAVNELPLSVGLDFLVGYTPPPVGSVFAPTISDFEGTVHQLGKIGGNGPNLVSVDGTGYFLKPVGNQGGFLITDRLGNRYGSTTISNVAVEDVNGNLITKNINSQGQQTSWTDTLGRTIPTPWLGGGMTSTSDFSGCTGSQPTTSAAVWSPPGPNGGTSPFKVCYGTFTFSFTPPDCINDAAHSFCKGGGGTSSLYLQSLVLPNGTAWTFEYDNFGDLSSITLPTGGTISYTWNYNTNPCGYGQTYIDPSTKVNTHLYPYGRGITSRSVNANDGTSPHVWNYSTTVGSSSIQTVVTDPAGNDAVHTETLLGSSCSAYETEVDEYNGSHTSGTGTIGDVSCANPRFRKPYTALTPTAFTLASLALCGLSTSGQYQGISRSSSMPLLPVLQGLGAKALKLSRLDS